MQDERASSLLQEDVFRSYMAYRQSGAHPLDAFHAIQSEYHQEMYDADDGIHIILGLEKAVSFDQSAAVISELLDAIQKLQDNCSVDGADKERLEIIKESIRSLPPASSVRQIKPAPSYSPKWETGDVFEHKLMYPASRKLGIEGWSLLLIKVGDYQNLLKKTHQLVCAALCEPGSDIVNKPESMSLGYLRIMRRQESWTYLCQLAIHSKRQENLYQLTKLGNFPKVIPYQLLTCENPETSMPLFAKKTETGHPSYEDQICRIFRRNGVVHL